MVQLRPCCLRKSRLKGTAKKSIQQQMCTELSSASSRLYYSILRSPCSCGLDSKSDTQAVVKHRTRRPGCTVCKVAKHRRLSHCTSLPGLYPDFVQLSVSDHVDSTHSPRSTYIQLPSAGLRRSSPYACHPARC